jgi:tetratricopeptide (TPR) repeat protein
MNRFFHNLSVGLYGLLCLILLAVILPVHASEKSEDADPKTLSDRVAQLQHRINQNPDDYEAIQGIGITYHAMAIKDSRTYAGKAVQFLEQAHEKRPDDNLVLCYLGSAYTSLAKDVWNPMSKSSNIDKGIMFMDKAVRKEPDNITIRLTRASNSRALPKFLNRRSIAYEDLEYLDGLFERGMKVSPTLKISVYSKLAALYRDDGNINVAQKYQSKAETIQKEK